MFCGKFKINLITLRKKPEDFFSPYLTLADEPTGNLDSRTSLDVMGLLKVTSEQFAQTIVMITHNEEIAQMADRIIRIEDGRIAGDHNV